MTIFEKVFTVLLAIIFMGSGLAIVIIKPCIPAIIILITITMFVWFIIKPIVDDFMNNRDGQ